MPNTAYTTSAAIVTLAGERAVDLRSDDAERDELMDEAIDHGSSQIDFYTQGKYLEADLAASRYVNDAATAFALEYWCLRRLNDTPKAVSAWADRFRDQLQMVLEGKAGIPGAARSRRPVTVTNQRVDLRRPNNQVRTDTTRSTGVAKDYVRPTDPTAPDCR